MARSEPISVLMPVRDGESTLRAALADVTLGLDEHDELLVVDDGSQDRTSLLLAELGRSESRLRVVQTAGVGLVSALNLGLQEASNRLIARADADDRYPGDRLDQQRAAVRPGAVLVTGDYRIVAGRRHLGELPCALTPPFVSASLINPQRIPHPGVLFDREAVIEAGGYRAEDFPTEDLALWIRLSALGDFVGVPAVTVEWSMSRESITHANQGIQRSKTAELLKTLPPAIFTGISVDDVEGELAAYKGTRHEAMRKVLLARDLRSLTHRGLAPSVYRESIKALGKDPLRTLRAAGRLAQGKSLRDRVRESMDTSIG